MSSIIKSSQPKYRGATMRSSTFQTIANSTVTKVVFGAVTRDTDNFADTANNEFVIPAGRNMIITLDWYIYMAAHVTGHRLLQILRNGVTTTLNNAESFNENKQPNSLAPMIFNKSTGPFEAIAGDKLSIELTQSSGTGLQIGTAAGTSLFKLTLHEILPPEGGGGG